MNRALLSKLIGGAILTATLTGCIHLPPLPAAIQDLGPAYKPTNIYRRGNMLPEEIRRVALLPLSTTAPTSTLQDGVEALEPGIYVELEKTKRFEVIPISRTQLQKWTGRTSWRSDEALPADLFLKLREAIGCDAVMFCQLTRFQPYQPVAVGWKFSLIQTTPDVVSLDPKAQILWSADEVLDAGDAGVANAARAYYGDHLRNDAPAEDVSTMMSSPARFGQYTLNALLNTLPERYNAVKAGAKVQ